LINGMLQSVVAAHPSKKGRMSLSLFDPILGILKAAYYAIDDS